MTSLVPRGILTGSSSTFTWKRERMEVLEFHAFEHTLFAEPRNLTRTANAYLSFHMSGLFSGDETAIKIPG